LMHIFVPVGGGKHWMANPPAAKRFASGQPSAMSQFDSYQGFALAMPQSSNIGRPLRGCTTWWRKFRV